MGKPNAGGSASGDEQGREEPGSVNELASISTLQHQFNRGAGSVRLILLISPT